MNTKELIEQIEDTLNAHIINSDKAFERNWVIFTIESCVLIRAVDYLLTKIKCRFVTAIAMQVTRDFDLYYHFCQDRAGLTIDLHVVLPHGKAKIESISGLVREANRIELGIRDQYGIKFLHHQGSFQLSSLRKA